MYSTIQKYKQTHFHRHKKIAVKHIHLGTMHLAAWVLTFSAVLSFAKTIHHDYLTPANESAKMPRIEKTAHYEYDYDIGLRMPHISTS